MTTNKFNFEDTVILETEPSYIDYPIFKYAKKSLKRAKDIHDYLMQIVSNEIVAINLFGTGVSGGITMSFLSSFGDIYTTTLISKRQEITHRKHIASNAICIDDPETLNIFVDDFISSGKTYIRVLETMQKNQGNDFRFDLAIMFAESDEIVNRDRFRAKHSAPIPPIFSVKNNFYHQTIDEQIKDLTNI